jgi:hypothetical protein
VDPPLACDRFEPCEFGERVGMIVDSEVEKRVVLLIVNEQRHPLIAALVAVSSLSSSGGGEHCRRPDQPFRMGDCRPRCHKARRNTRAGQADKPDCTCRRLR